MRNPEKANRLPKLRETLKPTGNIIVALIPRVSGPLLVLACAVAFEALTRFEVLIPNPPAILVLLVVYATFRGGYEPGLVSAALALTYIAWFFSLPGQPFEYSRENLVRVLVWAFSVPAMVWMIGRLKRQLVSHAEQYLQAIEAAPDGMLMVDRQGRIVLLNKQIETLFGYARAELIGQPVELLVPERIRAAHPGHRDGFFVAPRTRAMGAGRDLRGRRKDGTEFPVEIGLNPVSGTEGSMVMCSVVDITERKRREEHSAQMAERLDLATSAAQIGVWDWHLPTNTLLWDDRMFSLYGVRKEDFAGAYDAWLSGVLADDRAMCDAAIQQALGNEKPYDIEFRVRRPDGMVRVIKAHGRVERDPQGKPLRMTGVNYDITEDKRAQAALVVAKNRAETADRLKSSFLATMSHELRTPLNSIIGFTGIILQGLAGPLNPEQAKQLGMVQVSARHLLALINDVLDISKIEAGELKVDCEPFDLRASIARVVDIVTPLAATKGLALRAEVAPAIGEVAGDARRVEQVLLNLINNAIKFTERGEITLSAALSGDAVRIRISDTGIGIKPEDMQTLFQPFRQVDDGLARNHEGTGLGLTICRRLAELMGGEIQAESEWGKGSTFSFMLPLGKG